MTATANKNAKLHIIVGDMRNTLKHSRLAEMADLAAKQGWEHPDSKVEDAAASLTYHIDQLKAALDLINEGTR